MTTRTYANKNIQAVLKQEMKNCNITKTFPRADIWAPRQLSKTTVNDSAVAALRGDSCAKSEHVWESRVPASVGGHGTKNTIFRVKPRSCSCRWIHINFGEKVESGQPQRSIPQRSLCPSQDSQLLHIKFMGTFVREWLVVCIPFISQISSTKCALAVKVMKGKRHHEEEPCSSLWAGLCWAKVSGAHRIWARRALATGPWMPLSSWRSQGHSAHRGPGRRRALGTGFNLACPIRSPLTENYCSRYSGDSTVSLHHPASWLAKEHQSRINNRVRNSIFWISKRARTLKEIILQISVAVQDKVQNAMQEKHLNILSF